MTTRVAQSDAELLVAYLSGGADAAAAFEGLVARHGGMVHQTCRRVLSGREATEDAVQATFLVLARRAGAVRGNLGAFLHGVALNVARSARREELARRQREKEAAEMSMRDSEASGRAVAESWERLRPGLDAAIERLPAGEREAVVLHYLEGRTQAEIAGALRLPEGTVAWRLHRALERLRASLSGLHPGLSVEGLAAALAAHAPETACPPYLLAAAGSLGATSGGALVGTKVTALAEGGIKAMFWMKLKIVAAVACASAAVAGGGGVAAHYLVAGEPAPAAQATPAGPAVKAAPEEIETLKKQLAAGNGKEGRYNSRPSAMCSLGKLLAPKDLLELLTPFIAKPKVPVEERNTAALVLGKFGGKEAVPALSAALAKALEAKDRDAAYIAAAGLGLAKCPEAAAPLLAALKGAESSVRFRAARSLGMTGGKAAEAALIETLEKSDRTTRHAATTGLAQLAGAKGLEALKKALADEDPLIRRGAAWALLQRKDAAALQAEAKKVWETPVPPPAYQPRNKQLADLADNTWVKLGDSPAEYGQNETQWCYDAANRLLFRQSGCPYSTEAWALDIGTMTWVKRRPYDDFYSQQVEPTVAPWKYCCLVGTCYDSDARVVRLWGGTWGHHQYGGYDLAADDYINLKNYAPPGSSGTEAQNPVYDPVGKRVIAFGGVMVNEMDYWDAANDKLWKQKTATPGLGNSFPRYPTSAAAYDAENKLVVCFSFTSPTGNYSPEPAKRGPNETWLYDPATNTWRNAKAAVQPQIMDWGGLAYDSHNRTLILSIGAVPGKGETWRYDVKANTWTDLKPAGGGPVQAVAYRLSYDPEHNVCVGVFTIGYEKQVWAYRYKSVPAGARPGEAKP